MAQHGYLGDGYGVRGDVGDDDFYDRNRDDRERSHGRDEWRGSGFGRDHDRERMHGDHDHDRGWMDRARGWFDDDEGNRGRDAQRGFGRQDQDRFSRQNRGWSGDRENNRDSDFRPALGGFGNQTGWQSIEQNRQRPSAHPDDHYRSWRDKQMQSLDRDYEDYCREREQQFHSDFDSWRQNRQSRQAGQNDELLLERSRMGQQGDVTTTGTGRLGTLGGDPSASIDGGGAEVGAGSAPGHEPTSVGSGSELAGSTGSMINETAGGASGRKKNL